MLSSFEWNVKEYKVQTRNKGSLTILRDIVIQALGIITNTHLKPAGRASKGTLTAILGPSGAGKSSLLDCLTLRTQNFTGALRLNGKPLTNDYFWQMGYVHQDALFFSHLTPREHLTFHAITRLSHALSQGECEERVETVLKEVDLTHVAETYIGGNELFVSKGLSGGERKRLNIATELLARPSLLLLDEPTSGLDSVMARLICLLIESLAKGPEKRIVVAAVHAPSSELFTLFTHLTLLTGDGCLAYAGPREQLLGFLEGLGHVCPHHFNPADFALQLVSSRTIDTLSAGFKEKMVETPLLAPSTIGLEIANAWSRRVLMGTSPSSRLYSTTLLESDDKHRQLLRTKGSRASFWVLFRMNFWREYLEESRDKAMIYIPVSAALMLGFIVGWFYYQKIPGDQGRITAGFLISLVSCLELISGFRVVLFFPFDFPLLMRETSAAANRPETYFLGRTVASFPALLVILFMSLIMYVLAGMRLELEAIGCFCVVICLFISSVQSCGYLASSFSSNPTAGIWIQYLLNVLLLQLSGGYLNRSSLPKHLRLLETISSVNYALALLVLNQVKVGGRVEEVLLHAFQVQGSDFNYHLLKLAGLAVAYRIIAYKVMLSRVRSLSKSSFFEVVQSPEML